MTYNPNLKILTVCEGGNVRSVCLATLLRTQPHRPFKDVFSIGVKHATPETFAFIASWAEIIFAVGQREVYDLIPDEFKPKTHHVDIGHDHWGNPANPDLRHILNEMIYHDAVLIMRLGYD